MSQAMDQALRVHFDGGARGNPGPAGYGVWVADRDGNTVAELYRGIGFTTNNQAEYRAALAGLRWLVENGHRTAIMRGDSLLVVNQMKGLWKIRNGHMAQRHDEAKRLERQLDLVRWQHIPRTQNTRADALANRAMDEQREQGRG